MIYPRLKVARDLLTEDGVIFISIGDEEIDNLKKVADEVFGSENFRNHIVVRRGAKSVQAQFDTWDKLGKDFEYILLYTRNSTPYCSTPMHPNMPPVPWLCKLPQTMPTTCFRNSL